MKDRLCLKERKMGKTIILCFDGTCENFGPDPFTNVLKIYRLLDTRSQLCYYQPGIGTSGDFDAVYTWARYLSWSRLKNVLDSMFAFCLDDHIVSAYLFLMRHYEINDQIYMFGFSRGAFIARVLTGMLERVGLLNVGLEDMVHMAWRIYENWEFAEQPIQPSYMTTLIQEFTKTFCRDYPIKIYFQGLFDSVNSVGLCRDRLFPCTQRSNIIKHVRHAVSLDERRGKFKQFCFTPNPYEPILFSKKYKPYEKEIIKSVVATPILKASLSSNEKQPLLNNEGESKINQKIRKNPLIELTLKSSKSNSSFSSLQNVNLSNVWTPITEQTVLINQINSFLSPTELLTFTSRKVVYSNKSIKGLNDKNREYNIDNENDNLGIIKVLKSQEELPSSSMNLWTMENNTSSHSTISPDLIEKWFPGDHSDVGGGGGVYSGDGQCISNLSLRWMIAEAIKHGVKFKPGSINRFAERYSSKNSLFSCLHDFLDIKNTNIMGGVNKSFNQGLMIRDINDTVNNLLENGFEEDHNCNDNYDSSQSVANCYKINTWVSLFWWILEFLPIGIRVEDEEGKWRNRYVPNLGRSRCVPEYGELHWSIIWIMKFNEDYRPKNVPRYVREVLFERLNINLLNIKTLDTLILDENDKKDELIALINDWIVRNWENIPDDLYEVIKDDPTL